MAICATRGLIRHAQPRPRLSSLPELTILRTRRCCRQLVLVKVPEKSESGARFTTRRYQNGSKMRVGRIKGVEFANLEARKKRERSCWHCEPALGWRAVLWSAVACGLPFALFPSDGSSKPHISDSSLTQARTPHPRCMWR